MSNKEIMDGIIKSNQEHIIAIRELIHEHPELSFKEYKTSELVRKELTRLGIKYENSTVENGIVAEIDSGRPGKLLLLRADMDALPIQEETSCKYKSKVDNVMHACGHDIHTANLLGVGHVLNEMKDQWRGRIKLVFQPAEEAGGGGGKMIKAGLMDQVPDACFALHVSDEKLGHITAGSKYLTSYSDRFLVSFNGQAAHSSTPEKGIDAIEMAISAISSLKNVVTSNLNPLDVSALNIGKINGGTAPNIIPSQVSIDMMMRNKTQSSRDRLAERIEKICKSTAEMYEGTCDFKRIYGYDAVYNDEDLTDFIVDKIKLNKDLLYDNLSSDQVDAMIQTGDQFDLRSEDFGYYSQVAPSTLLWVGLGEGAELHKPNFYVDSKNIVFATKLMSLVAFDYLSQ
ncbi:amidohydrolase [Acidaminobacter sp. JC074]|uniref:M20 metallopeptidase family protein n=1 Tax=Acidaminobacter sp. JC074 TaxID=2530199 RepID=UPI001F1078A2|nr:M20 family metallopeptidase [Acidaminobacter sp. JC074]MCH4887904.1 amidohydrolase [Acidaminobacter sp. JC074]